MTISCGIITQSPVRIQEGISQGQARNVGRRTLCQRQEPNDADSHRHPFALRICRASARPGCPAAAFKAGRLLPIGRLSAKARIKFWPRQRNKGRLIFGTAARSNRINRSLSPMAGLSYSQRSASGGRLRVWDEVGEATDYSEPGWWEMGLLNMSDWQADWIGSSLAGGLRTTMPCPFLRRTFP